VARAWHGRLAVAIGLTLCTAFAAVAAPAADVSAAWCRQVGARLPGVSSDDCRKSGLQPGGGKSSRGQPIMVRHVVAAPGQAQPSAARPIRVLLIGGIHGDELTASAIVFQWMQWMDGGPARQFDWSVVPTVNPDGMFAPKPQRVNAHGVDLNRNFPTPGWQQDAPRYWVKTTRSDPRRFPGKSPLSEPETRWINSEIERFQPQVIISVHAPFGVLDFDGPAPTPHRFGRLIFNPVGVYPGSLGNYSGVHKNVPVITIELPNAQSMPPPAEVKRIWDDMLVWIRHNISEPREAAAQVAPKG